MNTNMTGFKGLSKNHCILLLWAEEASALEGLKSLALIMISTMVFVCMSTPGIRRNKLTTGVGNSGIW